LKDRSNSEKPNQTTFKTQFPLLRFIEVLLVAQKPKQSDLVLLHKLHVHVLMIQNES